jgi:hypothetical protein
VALLFNARKQPIQIFWDKAVQGPIKVGPLANHHGIFLRQGTSGISNHAIGFHLVNGTKPLKMMTTTTNQTKRAKTRSSPPIMAKDQAGNTGYVADPTILQRHPLPFSRRPGGKGKSVCSTPFGEGLEGAMGYRGLQKIQKILIHHDPKQQQQQQHQ